MIKNQMENKIIERDKKVISPSLTRDHNFVFERASNTMVYDVNGKKYLDFCAGVAVTNIGHHNKEVVKAIKKQLKKGIHCGFADFYAELPVKFAETLISFLPPNLNKVFLSNSGTESVECALKLARWYTKKKTFLAFEGAFHGRTMGSLSLTKSKPVQREGFEPFLSAKHLPFAYCYRCSYGKNCENCSFECLHAVEKEVKKNKNICSIFIEPIQGEGGYIVPPKEFHQGLRKICNENNILLCSDEVQSGSFRTGSFLALDNFGVRADIVSLSKAIGGGMPIGATVSSSKIMKWPPGKHANTFGGNLLACAAGIASLNYMKKKKLGERAKISGEYLLKRLNELQEKYKIIGDVRGIGLMIGVELVKDRKTKEYAIEERAKIVKECEKNGLILLPCGKSVIRFAPPLTVTKKEIDKALEIFEGSLK